MFNSKHRAIWLGILAVVVLCLAQGRRAGASTTSTETVCNNFFQAQMTTATTTQFVALVSGQKVRICHYEIQGSTTATASTFKLVTGTGTACATGQTALTPAWNMPASSTALPASFGDGAGELFQTPAGQALCGTSSAAGTINVLVTYAQF